jgi:hypothetical protein
MKHITTLAFLLAATSLAVADTKPAKSANPKPAKATPAPDAKRAPTDAKLAQLIGRWEGTSQFTVMGKTSTWKLTASCERAAIGPAVVCSTAGSSGDMQLEEMWMLAYDEHSQTHHLFMANSWGEAYDHAAKWTDAATVAFVHTGTRDNKPLVENYTLTFKGDTLTNKGWLKVGDKMIGEGVSTLKRLP